MLFLNAIWSKTNRAPSQWRSKVREYLSSTANMQFIKDRNAKTLVLIEALYAHAMWVDTEFYMTVVTAILRELKSAKGLQPQQTIKLKLQR